MVNTAGSPKAHQKNTAKSAAGKELHTHTPNYGNIAWVKYF